jgi:hypothetical protein
MKDSTIDRLKNTVPTKNPYSGDWHSTNTRAAFPEYDPLFTSSDPDKQKEAKKLRSIGKGMGLSLLFQDNPNSAGWTIHYGDANIGSSPEEAQKFADKFYNGVPAFTQSLKRIQAYMGKYLYSYTLFGRRWYSPKINDKDRKVRTAIKRNAVNFPIQSTASTQMNLIINGINKFIETYHLNPIQGNLKLMNSVYTSLWIVDSPTIEEANELLKSIPKGKAKVLWVDKESNQVQEWISLLSSNSLQNLSNLQKV